MNAEQENDAPQDNFSRLKEILISDFFKNKELIEKLDTIKDKINDWNPRFIENEGVEALALIRSFLMKYDDRHNCEANYLDLCDRLDASVPKNESGEYNFQNHLQEKAMFESAIEDRAYWVERHKNSIDLQWQFLSWLVDYVYPVHWIYHVKPNIDPDDIDFGIPGNETRETDQQT